ncbi:hypothetical protein [Propionivibrio dicarboxylicus]|uniref:DUF2946 domain-containing protein n=1 Tax=Propionivibrio dicarboxylicus TaxID=83767 RepID=A0A1G8ENU6_9RHOO|nr:hypothetical protein [Propionivibrio dicarboxylicus]SDH71551.1 hypothetical protein SAMN05660652_02143 [Propionivibrio dicarboxylicus]
MRRRSIPLFVFVCTFFLLFAQGAAFAHWIEHIGTDAQRALSASVQENADSKPAGQHERADEQCLSCLAYAGIVAAPPLDIAPSPSQVAMPGPHSEVAVTQVISRSILPYGARAPPVNL